MNTSIKMMTHRLSILTLLAGLCVTLSAQANWTETFQMEHERFESSAFQYKEDFYVFNGFGLGIDLEPTMEKFDAETLTWETIGNTNVLGISVTHNGVVLVGSDVWVLGGRRGNHPGTVVDTVWIYNIEDNTWRVGPSLPVPVAAGGAALVDNKIYWFGGLDPFARCDLPHHFVYDLGNEDAGWVEITDVAPMPVPRNHFGTAVLDDLIYTIGGQFGHDNCPNPNANTQDSNLVHIFNPATMEWSQKANLPHIQSHIEPSTFVHEGAIYVLGGESDKDAMFRYNPANDTWDTLIDLPEELIAPAARVIGDKLVVASGGAPNANNPTPATRYTDIQPLLLPSAPDDQAPGIEVLPLSAAVQSSTGFNGDAGRAIDGNTTGIYTQNSTTHTDFNDPQAWWEASLSASNFVTEVQVWNRTNNCCIDRLTDFYVFVSDTPFASTDVTATAADPNVTSYFHAGPAGELTTVPVNASGQYVRVQLTGTGFLSLAEVIVLGAEEAPEPTQLVLNSAQQSSTRFNGNASRAIDGNTSGVFSEQSTTHTAPNVPQAWWEATLTGSSVITEIEVWNRTDNCCNQRLADFYVFVSDTPFASNDVVETLNDPNVSSYFHGGTAGELVTVPLSATGQYIRVQLAGGGALALAEVIVFGEQ